MNCYKKTDRSDHHRRALKLSYFTVAYNIGEGLISVIAGYLAGSVALVGFGFDSFIESMSGGVMIWRFQKRDGSTIETEKKKEERAIQLVAYSFFVLAAYVLYESFSALYFQEIPEPSIVGIIIALLSLIVMPVLFFMKRSTANAVQSQSLLADAKQTLACMVLSVSLLLGLSMNYFFGFWYADPIAGIIIVVFLVREGFATLKEKDVCSC